MADARANGPSRTITERLIPYRQSRTGLTPGRTSYGSGAAGGAQFRLDRFFGVTRRGSDFTTELRAGTTAFLAASNNLVVNAHIMEHAGISADVSVVSGAFAAGLTCMLSGVLTNLPLGLVPSVGPNVFLAFSLVAKGAVDTDGALAISAAAGLVLLVISLTPVLKIVLGLVPLCIKYGLIIGTGLLSALIGLKSVGVVVADTGPSHDIVALGNLEDRRVGIAVVFLVVMTSMLHNGVKGAVLIGMLGATATDWILNDDFPHSFISVAGLTPHTVDWSVLGTRYAWVQVSALILMLLFSISGAVIGGGRMAGLLTKEGTVPGSTAVYVCCGMGTVLSACLGTSPIFVSMSAAAGIRDGGRTGLVSVVMGCYCLLTAFLFSPVAAAIPSCAVAPVLILVGVSMVGEAKEVAWWSMQEALPAFLCAVFQPFTYSVANGIYAGLGMSITLFITTGEFVMYLPGRGKQLEDEARMAADAATPADPSPDKVKPQTIAHSVTGSLNEAGFRLLFSDDDPVGGRRTRLSIPAEGASAPPYTDMRRTSTTGSGRSSKKFCRLPTRLLVSVGDVQAMSEPASGDSDHEQTPIRGTFSAIGRGARFKALDLIEQAAVLVGLDPVEVQKVVVERMHAGRNAEAHCLGGIPGSETNIARAIVDASCEDLVGSQDAAPLIAAAARRNRLRNLRSCNHFPSGDIDVIQTVPEDM